MKRELPAIFNTEMVQAILEGRKLNTRRPFTKVQSRNFYYAAALGEVSNFQDHELKENDMSYIIDVAPWHKGDTLYVRETLVINRYLDIYYKADNTAVMDDWMNEKWCYRKPEFTGEVPSIHMPKKASRLFLKVTNVRVERVQEITEEDARKEGVDYTHIDLAVRTLKNPIPNNPIVGGFGALWNSIYKNWHSNPWVWVIDFEVVKK